MYIKNKASQNFFNKLWVKILAVLITIFVMVVSVMKLNTTKEFKKFASLDEFTSYLDKRITALMKSYDIPGVNIALIQKGETLWSKAYGYADLEKGRRMTTDTYCRVESISKSVTVWGVMKLVEEGMIELDKPVAQYMKNWKLPESEYSEEKVTVRQLLTHTSGLPLGDIFERYSPKEKIPALEESLSKEAILMQEPGLSFSYSNTGYNLLELLIEEVTGRDFNEYMEKEILLSLGMYKSSFTWSEKLNPEVPVGYDLKSNPVSVYVYPEKASGGLFATVEDIAAFAAAGMTNFSQKGHRVLTSQSINKLYSPMVNEIGMYSFVFNSYGFGYYIEDLSNGNRAVANGGQGGGIMTHLHYVPETGDGIVILTNSQRSWPFIAYLVSDWFQWCGFDSVGMGKIIIAQKILWALIGLAWFIILLQAWKLGHGLISGRHRFGLLSKESCLLRLMQSVLFIILLTGLLWCINQDYLFISSVFPIAYSWLILTLFIFAVVLLLFIFFPSEKYRKEAAGDSI